MTSPTYILDGDLLAPNRTRFLNNIIDSTITYVISFIIENYSHYLIEVFDSFGLKGFGIWFYSIGTWGWIGISTLITIAYFLVTEGLFGKSPAKFITGTIVVDENGEKAKFGAIVKRTLCRLIPFEALSFLGSSGRGWHDTISDTYVVNKKALDEEIRTFYEFNLIGVQETN